MFSNNSAEHADACRFCWMCRHICPVAGSTGSEGWTPRARGLMVSMIERGTEYDAEIAETMYHCTMCDACSNDCVTGWKPTTFTREARMLAVVNEIAPSAILAEIENIICKNNIFGLENNPAFVAEAEKHPLGEDTLLYVGQLGRNVAAKTAINAMQILDKAGVKYSVFENEPASGAYLSDLMGFTGDVQKLAVKLSRRIENAGIKKIIVLNPYDAWMLLGQYREWNLLSNVEIVSYTFALSELLCSGAIQPSQLKLKASLQEPVKLTRGLGEIAPLKNIIKKLGIEHIELFLNGKMSRCVGTAIMEAYDSNVVKEMVRVRFEDAQRLGSDTLIAASPDDYYVISQHIPRGCKAVDIFEIINSAC